MSHLSRTGAGCTISRMEKQPEPADPHIRPVNPQRDLSAVADVIDACFSATIDPDGRRYLQRLRQAAQRGGIGISLQGLVWEDDGKVIGNLTIIPFREGNRVLNLIANVAVLPEHRRKGIGRALTRRALELSAERGTASAWLHVRDDNPAAQQLYRSLGFVERASRTTWQWEPRDGKPTLASNRGSIRQLRRADWDRQRAWLEENYPPEVCWNLGFHPDRLKTGFWTGLIRWLEGGAVAQWAAYQNNSLMGSLAWEPTTSYADVLWAASSADMDEQAFHLLLPHAIHSLEARRPLAVNYPAGRAVSAFQDANFKALHTLIWMEAKLKPSG